MSKRAEQAALRAYSPETKKAIELLPRDWNKPQRTAFIQGYEQAEKDTTQRALDWLMAHTKSYSGPIEEPFWTMFIEHFKKAMEEE